MHWLDRMPQVTLLAALALGACARQAPTDPTAPALSLGVVSGRRQRAEVGRELPQPLVVRVLDSRQQPVKGQLVTFRVLSGGGSVYAGSSLTDADGIARDYWTMGPKPGPARLVVRAVDPGTGAKRNFALFVALALGAPRYTLESSQTPAPQVEPASHRPSPSPDGDGTRER